MPKRWRNTGCKGAYRRFKDTPQVHAAVLSGHTETCRQPQNGSGGFAAAERNGAGGTQTGEKKRYRPRNRKGQQPPQPPTSPRVSVLFSAATRSRHWRGRTPPCIGKPLEYAGELYSEEHKRKFTPPKAGFQVLKDPTDGTRLVLAIDRKPIAEWFKEQFGKLRQNIRKPIQP